MSNQYSIFENIRRFVGIVEYDGTSFRGFQRQPMSYTVQGVIEKALQNMIGSFVQISSAGRTDAGVHAKGQVIAFSADVSYPTEIIKRALNARLPKDIRIISLGNIAHDFDPRRDAVNRVYRYVFSTSSFESVFDNRFSHYVQSISNPEKMNEAMRLFIGEHNFRNFAGGGVDPSANLTRNMSNAYVIQSNDKVELYFEANSFIRHQVRYMAGLILRVGLSQSSVADVINFLSNDLGTIRPPMLPAKGLFMQKVIYSESIYFDSELSQSQRILVS